MKKVFSAEYKAKVALEAMKGVKSNSEIATAYDVHPTQIGIWKQQLMNRASTLFTDKRAKDGKPPERIIDELYTVIGKRDVEIEWMKKNLQLMDT
ncbi:MAG: transposase [Patescibacteria group bacterium]